MKARSEAILNFQSSKNLRGLYQQHIHREIPYNSYHTTLRD
jgi:hypothetical protein